MILKESIFGKDENNNLEIYASENSIHKGKEQHHYTRYYNFYFSSIRDNNLNVLEIGVERGSSLKMQKEYFKNSNIYGIEKNISVVDKDLVKECIIFEGDQTDIKFLKKVCDSVEDGFDIIIDDGSHITSDQVETFEYLFKKMNSGGIYIIEDLQTSYRKSYKKGKHPNAIKYFQKRVNDVFFNGKFKCNSFSRILKKTTGLTKYERMIEGISFYPGMCFIFKRFCK